MHYPEYIRSAGWRALRTKALERDGYRCRMCDAPEPLEVHHRRYPPDNAWHLDNLDALTTLCVPCHDIWTNQQRARRYAVLHLSASDVARITPAVKVVHVSLPEPQVSDHQRLTTIDAQRTVSRSVEPTLTEHRRDYWKAEKG